MAEPARKKKRNSGQKSSSGALQLIRASGSTARVLNLASLKERWNDDPDYLNRPMFMVKRLNEAIILKHTPREHERDFYDFTGQCVTKIILPFDSGHLAMGGQSIFFEQPDFLAVYADTIGRPENDPDVQRDFRVLSELARLPSFDPYLLSEKLRREGFDISKRYFDISEADAERMREYVNEQIMKLVQLAFKDVGGNVFGLSNRLTSIFLQDEASADLDPLRETMRMSVEDYAKGMFAWKGFLYYKWQTVGLQRALKPVAQEILTVHIKQATPEDIAYLRAVRERIVRRLGQTAGRIRSSLERYDEAFNALTKLGEPGAFRAFLLAAPDMFVESGQQIAALNHITSFWRFRFPEGRRAAIDSWDAYDLFQEFESSLSGFDLDDGDAEESEAGVVARI